MTNQDDIVAIMVRLLVESPRWACHCDRSSAKITMWRCLYSMPRLTSNLRNDGSRCYLAFQHFGSHQVQKLSGTLVENCLNLGAIFACDKPVEMTRSIASKVAQIEEQHIHRRPLGKPLEALARARKHVVLTVRRIGCNYRPKRGSQLLKERLQAVDWTVVIS